LITGLSSTPFVLFRIAAVMHYISGSIVFLLLFWFSLVYPNRKIRSLKIPWLISIINLGILFLVAFTPFFFKDLRFAPSLYGSFTFQPFGYAIYVSYLICVYLLAEAILFWRLSTAKGLDRKLLTHLIIGTTIPGGIGIFTNLILPWFGQFHLFLVSPILVMLLFVGVSIYAVVNDKLFNLKVVATEVFVVILIGISALRFTPIAPQSEFTIHIIGLAFLVAFGILLIRSVIRDITQEEKIEKLVKARSEFLYIASHQLRTPVSVITGTLSLLQEGMLERVTPENRKSLIDGIFIKAKKLTNIINDILQASEMDIIDFKLSGQSVKPIDMRVMLDRVCVDLKEKAEEKHLEFEYPQLGTSVPITILGHERYLEQAISNIVDNAIKYTPQGFVRVELAEDAGSVIIKVSDSGIGIPLDDQPKIFEKFKRAKNAENAYTDGSGLGLFIVKKVIEAHPGGSIHFESAGEDRGSTFVVEFTQS
ncbi:MAG: ATP-binding protein, partial [Candidatus Sungiibacteriota bacterium]